MAPDGEKRRQQPKGCRAAQQGRAANHGRAHSPAAHNPPSPLLAPLLPSLAAYLKPSAPPLLARPVSLLLSSILLALCVGCSHHCRPCSSPEWTLLYSGHNKTDRLCVRVCVCVCVCVRVCPEERHEKTTQSRAVHRRTPKSHRRTSKTKGSLVIAFPQDFFSAPGLICLLAFLLFSLYPRYSTVALLASLVSVNVPRLFRHSLLSQGYSASPVLSEEFLLRVLGRLDYLPGSTIHLYSPWSDL